MWLALPPADLGPLALAALVPLLWAARGRRARGGAVLGFVFGLTYFGLLLSWLVPVTILGWSVLVLGQAAWMAVLVAYVSAVWREDRPFRTALAVAVGWMTVDWLRDLFPLGGFGWGGLGTTQHDNFLLLPLASVIGAWGLSGAVAAVNVFLLEAAHRGDLGWGKPLRLVGAAALLAVVPAAIPVPAPSGPAVDVAIVQGNIPERLEMDRVLEDRIVAENHATLHARLADAPPGLAVWPENALDLDPTRDPELDALVGDAIRGVRSWTLVGAITEDGSGRLFNDNLLYDPSGTVVGRYTKNHLVPFGEYVPFRPALEGWVPQIHEVRADLTPGEGAGRFRVPGASFSSAICFENAFAQLVREFTTRDMGFVVISTNNANFGQMGGPEQHLVQSELRAVENGRWVVHAALTGISAFVDPRGRVTATTAFGEPALLRGEVRQGSGRTIFNRIGGWLPAVFAAAALLFALAPRRPRRRGVMPLGPDARTAVVLPTYDEAETIEEVVRGVLAVGERVEVIVVDDGSPDGTADIVRRLGAEDPRVHLIERGGKQGLASAYRDGFRRALDAGFDLVVEMDADLSHRPEDLRALLAGAESHHLTIGSRYVPGGSIPDWPLPRRLLSRGGNLYARVLLGLPVQDATSGFRVFRRDALEELLPDGITSDGYGFQIELAYRAWRRGLSVGEVPITFSDRRAGQSKLSRRIILEAFWKVFAWGVRDRLIRRAPLTRTPSAVSSTQ